MFQCTDCGSQNPWHVCPKHPNFSVKEPGVVMTPRSAEALAAALDAALLQIHVIRNYVNEEGVSDTAKVIRVQGVVNKTEKPIHI